MGFLATFRLYLNQIYKYYNLTHSPITHYETTWGGVEGSKTSLGGVRLVFFEENILPGAY